MVMNPKALAAKLLSRRPLCPRCDRVHLKVVRGDSNDPHGPQGGELHSVTVDGEGGLIATLTAAMARPNGLKESGWERVLGELVRDGALDAADVE